MEKGTTNNPNGRPTGVPNKLTKELREVFKRVIQDELENIPELLKALGPQERIDVLIKLIKYVLPVPAPIEVKTGQRAFNILEDDWT
jgi:hypothetical protein